ncbi:MAG TPA: hypothetical protein VFC63_26740 [Blastocatellia bacterium]|nr:hypothetical protein [Blastocatellia bacterium]
MSIILNHGPKDDPEFIDLLSLVIDNVVCRSLPQEIYTIYVHRWFDHKWLEFSGIGVVPFEFYVPGIYYQECALDEFSQDKITFPPFNPKRIIEEKLFARSQSNAYREEPAKRKIHSPDKKHSSWNLHNRVADFSSSAAFIWYSSETRTNDRGSMMVYSAEAGTVKTWFASFAKRDKWKLDLVKGIDRRQVLDSIEQEASLTH